MSENSGERLLTECMIYREPQTDIGRLLCLAVQGRREPREDAELMALHQRIGDAATMDAARRNKVPHLVASTLEAVLGGAAPPAMRDALAANQRRVTALLDALRSISARLAALEVQHAVIESGGVLLASELPIAAYESGDLDILVPEARFHLALSCFEAEGFEPHDRRARPTRRIELKRTDPTGVDLHLEVGCSPFDRMWVPLSFKDRSPLWLERSRPARKRRDLAVLDDTDACLFVALHTSMHSFVRAPGLRLHVDVDRLVRDCDIDWTRFIDEAALACARTRVFVSLSMARGLLGTPIPDSVLHALSPPPGRCRAILALLAHNGVEAGGPKLPRAQAIALDALLADEGLGGWSRHLLLPPRSWMEEHFDREREDLPHWRLHLRRIGRLATHWRPE